MGLARLDLYVHTEDHMAVKKFASMLNEKRFGPQPQVQPKEKIVVQEKAIEEKLVKQAEEARQKFFKAFNHEV